MFKKKKINCVNTPKLLSYLDKKQFNLLSNLTIITIQSLSNLTIITIQFIK